MSRVYLGRKPSLVLFVYLLLTLVGISVCFSNDSFVDLSLKYDHLVTWVVNPDSGLISMCGVA